SDVCSSYLQPWNTEPASRKKSGPPPSPGAGRRVTTVGGSVVRGGCAGAARNADVLDQVLDVLRHRCGHLHRDVGGDEVDDRADRTEGQWRDAEQPVLGRV